MSLVKWNVGSYDAYKAQTLSENLRISSLAARVLCSRGISDEDSARAFLDTELSRLHDPMLLKDMQQAVERIEEALAMGEKIAVYGDYDVDGITSTYILLDYLQSLGADCVYHIPDREGEGYGVNIDAIEKLRDLGVTLIITVDTGITAVGEIVAAHDMGIDFIVTDHHECQQEIPVACAVINPHRADCTYPEKNLAGVGVAFKLICALEEGVAEQYLPFVCIGTVADVMPLVGENRIIVSQGIARIPGCRNLGLCALISAAGAEGKPITTDVVGFQLAPRINAAGRMSSASRVVELFCVQTRDEADILAKELCDLNQQRRSIETDIFFEAAAQVEMSFNPERDYALVIAGEGWHHGVLGIVASRICERYQRPAVLISVDDGIGKGSGRSVPGVNLFSALSACSEHLEKFGGHEQAAGLSIRKEKIEDFRRELNRVMEKDVKNYQPSMNIDFAVEPSELTVEEVRSLKVLEPFGTGNPRPILQIRNMYAEDITAIGGGKHLRMTLSRAGKLPGVFFGKTEEDLNFETGAVVDAVFIPEINDFRGENVQLMLRDIRPAAEKMDEVRCYNEFRRGVELGAEQLELLRVEYADLGAVWRYLVKNVEIKGAKSSVICGEINRSFNRKLSPVKLVIAFDIFRELGLVLYETGAQLDIKICGQIQKVDLANSPTARRLGCTAPKSRA